MKKEIMLPCLAAALALVGACSGTPKAKAETSVSVRNPADFSRTETIFVSGDRLAAKCDSASLRVCDEKTGKAIPHQAYGDGVIFAVDLGASETRKFRICDDADIPSADMSVVCWCDYVPERMDDFAWENDRFGARAYGPIIMQPAPKGQKLVSSGFDIFNKCVPYPVLDRWLRHRTGEGSYHTDHGEGMDNYKVATARGCGGIGARDKSGKWSYSRNWAKCEVICCGPVRCEFKLIYEPWGGFGKETRHVILDRGRSLAKMTASFDAVASGSLVGPGLDISEKRSHKGEISICMRHGWIADYEPKDGKNGSIMTAIVLDPASCPATEATDAEDSIYLLAKPDSRKSVTYYAGANWSGQKRYNDANAWHDYIADFASGLRKPVEVLVK